MISRLNCRHKIAGICKLCQSFLSLMAQSSRKDIVCIADMNLIAKQISLILDVRETNMKKEY